MPHLGLPLMLSVAHHRARRRRLSRAGPGCATSWPACSTPSAGGRTAASTRRCAACCRLSFAVTPHRPERPARHLPDGHLHRRRAGAARADGAVRRIARCAGLAAASLLRMGRACHRRDRPRRGRLRQRPADGDRLARHPGFCGGAAVHAVRRARPLLHPVHGRDAVGGDPGAGDDAAEAVADRPSAGARKDCWTAPSRLPAGSASGCCCSR